MRKVLLVICCLVFLVGFVDTGNAFLFFGGGGGGKGGRGSGGGVDTSTLFKQDFHQFGVRENQNNTGDPNHTTDPYQDLLGLMNPGGYDGGHDRDNHSGDGNDPGSGQNQGYQPPDSPGTAPVPEPTTMLLLGLGLIGLSGYGRRKFNK